MNQYTFKNDICIISVESKIHGALEFLIDKEDFPRIKNFKWVSSKKKNESPYCRAYICSNKRVYNILLHRLITSFEYKIVDHINGNTLDNRKCNLRDGSNGVNQRNRKVIKGKSLPIGVYLSGKNYRACITRDNKKYNLGTYKTIKEAEQSYLNFRHSSP